MGKFIYFKKHSGFAEHWLCTDECVCVCLRFIFRYGGSLFVMMLSAELFLFHAGVVLRQIHLGQYVTRKSR